MEEYNHMEFKMGFITPRTHLGFVMLRQAFIIAPIIYYFDLEWHIPIEPDSLSHTIDKIFG